MRLTEDAGCFGSAPARVVDRPRFAGKSLSRKLGRFSFTTNSEAFASQLPLTPEAITRRCPPPLPMEDGSSYEVVIANADRLSTINCLSTIGSRP